ncbi:MAG: VapE family protein [Saprospiraceae bacterium]
MDYKETIINTHAQANVKILPTTNRKDLPVSIFKGCRGHTKRIRQVSLREFLTTLTDSNNTDLVELSKQLKSLKESDSKAYAELKETESPAFIMGVFDFRNDKDCKTYSPLQCFDIDGLDNTLVSWILDECKKLDYVFAAFPSVSGAGLRIMIFAQSTPNTHKAIYQAIIDRLSKDLNVPTDKDLREQWKGEGLASKEINQRLKKTHHLDSGTNNISRIWFYAHVKKEDCFVNWNSSVFKVDKVSAAPKQKVVHRLEEGKDANHSTIDDAEKIRLCLHKVEHQNLAPGRNNFVFALACEFCRFGVLKDAALSHCTSYAEPNDTNDPFTKEQIVKTVDSAYKGKSREFSDAQIINYRAKLDQGAVRHHKEQEEEEQEDESPESPERAQDQIKLEKALEAYAQFRFNEILGMPEYQKNKAKEWALMDDYVLNSIVRDLKLKGIKGASKTRIAETIESGFAKRSNPIQEYFIEAGNNDDGNDYIAELCQTVAPLAGQNMFRKYFEKWLVGAVANTFIMDRCANHLCFILTGRQGTYKSTWIRMLCPTRLKKYYFEGNLDPENKDNLFVTTANFIYNMDDYFASITIKKINEFKGFLTKNTVKARKAYGHYPEELPKICSFIASSNEDQFLYDTTGNRRFLPFEVSDIDIEAMERINIDKVYGQAYRLYKSGFQYWLSPEDQKELQTYNEQFEVQSLEYELVTTYFEVPKENNPDTRFLINAQILQELRKNTSERISTRKLGEALKKAGFERKQMRMNGKRVWGYHLIIRNEEEIREDKLKTTTYSPPLTT